MPESSRAKKDAEAAATPIADENPKGRTEDRREGQGTRPRSGRRLVQRLRPGDCRRPGELEVPLPLPGHEQPAVHPQLPGDRDRDAVHRRPAVGGGQRRLRPGDRRRHRTRPNPGSGRLPQRRGDARRRRSSRPPTSPGCCTARRSGSAARRRRSRTGRTRSPASSDVIAVHVPRRQDGRRRHVRRQRLQPRPADAVPELVDHVQRGLGLPGQHPRLHLRRHGRVESKRLGRSATASSAEPAEANGVGHRPAFPQGPRPGRWSSKNGSSSTTSPARCASGLPEQRPHGQLPRWPWPACRSTRTSR